MFLFLRSSQIFGSCIRRTRSKTDPSKTEFIYSIQIRTNVDELKSVLGITNYYSKFIKNLSFIAGPLYNLFKKETEFKWIKACTNSFNNIY